MSSPARPVAIPNPAVHWARRNLFRTPVDGAVTLVAGAASLYVLYRLARFVLITGRWEIVDSNLKLLLVGRWPDADLNQLAFGLIVLVAWAGVIAGIVRARQARAATLPVYASARARAVDLVRRFGPVFATVALLLALSETAGPWLLAFGMVAAGLAGRALGLLMARRPLPGAVRLVQLVAMVAVPVAVYMYLTAVVPFSRWEGFLFNVSAATAGVVLSFPLGVLLALGRRSTLPLIRAMSTVYVELVRASPLYVLLLLANVSLEFFVPAAWAPSKPVRAVVIFTLFTAAYLAEIVRGGLQSVPVGQYEAARSLGLSPVKQMGLVVLPQALRNVIPAQIGQLISLFKDTALAGLGLGILELLSVSEAMTQQPDYRGQGLIIESLAFISLLFWVGSFTLSRESQRLERKLGVGSR